MIDNAFQYLKKAQAADTFGASEQEPVRLVLGSETIPTGVAPESEVAAGGALWLSWVEPRGESGHALRYAVFEDGSWSAPIAKRKPRSSFLTR